MRGILYYEIIYSVFQICDFGLARVADPDHDHTGFLTEYVATRDIMFIYTSAHLQFISL